LKTGMAPEVIDVRSHEPVAARELI
jgi:hypothetical protein